MEERFAWKRIKTNRHCNYDYCEIVTRNRMKRWKNYCARRIRSTNYVEKSGGIVEMYFFGINIPGTAFQGSVEERWPRVKVQSSRTEGRLIELIHSSFRLDSV